MFLIFVAVWFWVLTVNDVCRFHGNCINVTEKEAKHIKNFYCKPCRGKNPFLKIKYRKSKKKSEKERHERQKEKEKLKKKKLRKKDSGLQSTPY